jgi:hypothetical protein
MTRAGVRTSIDPGSVFFMHSAILFDEQPSSLHVTSLETYDYTFDVAVFVVSSHHADVDERSIFECFCITQHGMKWIRLVRRRTG